MPERVVTSFISKIAALVVASVPAHAAPTLCDRMASHPADPDRKATGVVRNDMDLSAAETACRQAVATDPRNARAHYQLGRVLYYQDKVSESIEQLTLAADTGYRQAIFVLGYLYSDGKAPRDECKAARLWLRSAALDHPWSGYYLVKNVLDGRFDKCDLGLTHADLERYLALARDNISVSDSDGRLEALTGQIAASQQPSADVER